MRAIALATCSWVLAAAAAGCGNETEIPPPPPDPDPTSACQPSGGPALTGRSGRTWTALKCLDGTAQLTEVGSSGPDDVWVAGRAGAVFRWDGRRWSQRSQGVTTDVTGLWVAGADSVWMIANDRQDVLRWDGAKWTASLKIGVSTGGMRGLWSSSPTDVWAVGGAIEPPTAMVQRWNGRAWAPVTGVPTPGHQQPLNVFGSSRDDVWLVLDFSGLKHWDGRAWSDRSRGDPGIYFNGPIWAPGPADAWALGAQDKLYRFRNGVWAEQNVPIKNSSGQLSGTAAGDVWLTDGAALWHWDGAAWSVELEGVSAQGVWALGRDVWVVGDGGSILHSRKAP